jgi:uncharacterized membrane protein
VLLMKRFLGYFLNGLLFSAPIALTLYVCYRVFRAVDSWLNLPIPGTGFIATVVIITLVGYLASTFLWKTVFSFVEEAMGRLPFVRYLYTALKDVLGAFVGERRRFDKPVMVTLTADGHARALGFLTQESLQRLGLAGMVAVYLPQSYNFAGQLLLFPADQVAPVTAQSSDVMAFIVSGGVVDVADRERGAPPTPAT